VLVFQVVQLFEKSQVGHRGGVLASLIIDVKLVKNSYIELLGASIFILRGHGGLGTSRDEEAARWGGKHGRDEGTTSTISAEA
jgi:hypothetical protein